jgi:hypothetical protein
MKRRALPGAVGLAGATLLAALAASADPKEELCDTNYQRGLKAAGQGDWGAANKLFEQVARDCPGFGALLALAKSEMHLKPAQLLSARRHFKEALAAAREPGERSLASDGLVLVENQLGKLRLEGAPEGASVLLDGRPESPEDGLFFVDPGAHQLTIETEGCPPQREVIDVTAGAEKRIGVHRCEKAAPPDAGAPPASSSDAGPPDISPLDAGAPDAASSFHVTTLPTNTHPRPSLLGPLLLGVGGLAVGAAGGFLWQQASGRYDSTITACPGNRCPSEAARDEVNRTRHDMLLGQVIVGVSAISLVGAGVWWLLIPDRKPAEATRIMPSVGPAGWGLSLRGTL